MRADLEPRPNQTAGRFSLAAPLLVAALALAAYAPARHLGFVSLDDRNYAAANSFVLSGVTAEGAAWAFTTFHAANWHPLTWLSLMLDAELGGGSPYAFHLTNVLLHCASSALVFLFLRRTTGAVGRSLFAAALFAVHPLHVESVAWIAERKDVLATFFGLLALLAYVTPRAAGARIPVVTGLLAASLMSKPTLVTAPLLLLVVDVWPLGRVAAGARSAALVREKWPLFLLSAASCAITLAAQSSGGALRAALAIPLWARVLNAALAAVAYLADSVAPLRLAVFYPHPGRAVSIPAALAASLFLAALTVLAWRARRVAPYFLAGWSWYLVALLPVAGLVQVGLQARADRYTYVPLLGIAIVGAWGVPDLAAWVRSRTTGAGGPPPATLRWIGAAAAAAAVFALALATRRQLRFWETDVALYSRALAVTKDNDLAHAALGTALAVRGDYEQARRHLDEALRLRPDAVEARHERAVLHLREREPERAAALWRALLVDSPGFAEARAGLAAALVVLGDFDAAERESAAALATSPRLAEALAAQGAVRLARKQSADAERAFRAAVQADPASAEYRVGLGNALAGLGRRDEAIAAYRAAARLDPSSYAAQLPLGALLFETGHTEEGLAHLAQAARVAPERPEVQLNLGVALYKLGRVEEAKASFERALRADPHDERAAAFLRIASAAAPKSR